MPPRWTVEPVDSNVAAGQDVTLHCQADGYPTPQINWRKAIGKQVKQKILGTKDQRLIPILF